MDEDHLDSQVISDERDRLKRRVAELDAKVAALEATLNRRDRALEEAKEREHQDRQQLQQLSVDVARLTVTVSKAGSDGKGEDGAKASEAGAALEAQLGKWRALEQASQIEVAQLRVHVEALSAELARYTYELDKVRREKDRFRHLLEYAGEAILIVDRTTGLFVDLNATACRWFGYTRERLLSVGPYDPVLSFPSEKINEMADAASKGSPVGAVKIDQMTLHASDGSAFDADVSVTPCKFDVRSYALVVIRRGKVEAGAKGDDSLAEMTATYNAILAVTPDPIFLAGRDGSVVEVNDSMASFLGYSREDLVGIDARRLFHDQSVLSELRAGIERSGVVHELQAAFLTSAGDSKSTTIHATLRRGEEGAVLGYICIIKPSGKHQVSPPFMGKPQMGEFV
ncbi:MAG: PAS domain S-box protein [Gemmatimonadota bacterium]|nr:PAS domain S-box protein [Gemmatimonadota bacterium]MDH5804176.1 PAS domain S-box protein [Gemmatimonadota bacterium]